MKISILNDFIFIYSKTIVETSFIETNILVTTLEDTRQLAERCKRVNKRVARLTKPVEAN